MGGAFADVLIEGGRIAAVGRVEARPDMAVEDGGGAIVVPGLIDAHTHLDKTLWGMPWYRNETGADLRAMIDNERAARTRLGLDPHRQSMRHAILLAANGASHIRSHVDIDTDHGLAMLEGVLATREALRGIIGIEIVAFPQSGLLSRPGTLELIDAGLRAGAEVVGGLDPCGIDRDPKGHLDAVFGLAERHGKPIDIHLHEAGELGAFSMELIFERTRALGMQGKVAVSHAFCLGMPDWRRTEALIRTLADLDIRILTVGSPSREVPEILRLAAAGVKVGAGCDGVRDTWAPSNLPDMIDRARIIAMKNNLRRDDDLAFALAVCSTGGAAVMNLEGHGLEVGCNADLTLLAGETLAESVVSPGMPRPLVLKRGRVVARDGTAVVPLP
jgi:cytosine deaminase